ncbi:MAG: hypothetical protein WCR74_17210 [Betaproteobacteria bacterium]|nr:hypothetical protein [Pseudomonadota bacterium]
MLVLRLVAVLVGIALAVSILLWLFTRNRKYLRFAFRVFQFAVFAALIVLALMALERVAVLI